MLGGIYNSCLLFPQKDHGMKHITVIWWEFSFQLTQMRTAEELKRSFEGA